MNLRLRSSVERLMRWVGTIVAVAAISLDLGKLDLPALGQGEPPLSHSRLLRGRSLCGPLVLTGVGREGIAACCY
jgi:hypothetical protein